MSRTTEAYHATFGFARPAGLVLCDLRLRRPETVVDNEDDARAFLATRGNLLGLVAEPQYRLGAESQPRLAAESREPIDDSPWQRAAADDFIDPVPDYDAAEPPPDSS